MSDEWSLDALWEQMVNDPYRRRDDHERAALAKQDAYEQIKKLRLRHGAPFVFVDICVLVPVCDACTHFYHRAMESPKPVPQIPHGRWWIDGYRALGMSRKELSSIRRAVASGLFVRCRQCCSRIEVGGGEGFHIQSVSLTDYFDLDITVGQRIPPRVGEVALELFGTRCVICGEEATTLDHIVARAHGGASEVVNLQPMCEKCNNAKADTPVDRVSVQLTFPLRPAPSDGYEGSIW